MNQETKTRVIRLLVAVSKEAEAGKPISEQLEDDINAEIEYLETHKE